jgi:type I restriction enzyme S subunit
MTKLTSKPALVPRLRFPEFREAGGWEQKKLGRLGDVLMCKRIFSNETNGVEGVPFFKIGTLGSNADTFISKELFDSYKAKYNYPRKGEILITCSGTVGKCLPYDGKDAYYQDSNIVWIDNPTLEISNEFLYRLLLNVDWERLNSTTITRIYGADLRDLSIAFPVYEEEQQKIATCLSSLDELIAAEAQKLDTLKTHKKGLMQQVFPAEGEAVPHLRFPEFRKVGEWESVPLAKFFRYIRNGFVGTATPYYVPNGIPYLQGKNVKQGQISSTELVTISNDFHRRQKKSQLNADDVLMVQSGHVGECAVVGNRFSGSNCHALIVLSPFENIDSRFFVYYFYSPQGLTQISGITTGNTIKHILSSDLQVLTVTAPVFEEQQKIADYLSSLDELITAQTQKLATLKTHKKGLMQQLFPSTDEVCG